MSTVDSRERDDDAAILHAMLDLGVAMFAFGAEVRRVEDTISRIGMAYGAKAMNVYVITASIVTTMTTAAGRDLTSSRRITRASSNDFEALDELNSLSREYCARPFATAELQRSVDEIASRTRAQTPMLAGCMLVAFGYTLFFGGTFVDAVAALAFGALAWAVQRAAGSVAPSVPVFNVVVSFICGAAIRGVSATLPSLRTDMIMMSVIMIMVPGIVMTNSIRDIITGHTISGTMRLTESLVWAASLACGFTLAMLSAGR